MDNHCGCPRDTQHLTNIQQRISSTNLTSAAESTSYTNTWAIFAALLRIPIDDDDDFPSTRFYGSRSFRANAGLLYSLKNPITTATTFIFFQCASTIFEQ
jgi:hypothetical protein